MDVYIYIHIYIYMIYIYIYAPLENGKGGGMRVRGANEIRDCNSSARRATTTTTAIHHTMDGTRLCPIVWVTDRVEIDDCVEMERSRGGERRLDTQHHTRTYGRMLVVCD